MINEGPTNRASASFDVLVVGGGPAGRTLAAECGDRGLRTALVDAQPDRPWRNTYGAWIAELPAALPASVVAARAGGTVIGTGEHALGWDYAVLDTAGLRAHLDGKLAQSGVEVIAGRVGGPPRRVAGGRTVVPLTAGGGVEAAVVIDAGGHRQPLSVPESTGVRAEQSAVGVVVDEAAAAPLVRPGEAMFMDWRADHGEVGCPSFLYGIPLGGGRVLLEETSLARRPGLALATLRRRLHARLAHHRIRPPADAPEERVRFPVDTPPHRNRAVLAFGAAAPLIHPATGYSVATSLRLAPPLAAAIARGLLGGPAAALDAGRGVVWPRSARAVHLLRQRALEALLRMPPQDVPPFFEHFFALPARHRWAFLTAREDLRSTFSAMLALLPSADWALRRRLLRSVAYRRPAR